MHAPQNPSPHPAIATAGLHKSFGDTVVLSGIDLDVAEGTVFALLGPNGAGKTTMIHILTTLLSPDEGDVRVAGHDVVRDPDGVRHAIGMTGQFAAVDSLLTGAENLRLMADLCHLGPDAGRRRVTELLEQFDLVDASDKPPSAYSGGMRRRLDLAMTLVGNPRLIFLDEPTSGLDPRSRHTMWNIIRRLVTESGVTIFLTTQYLEEADELADSIGVLDGGRLVAEGTASELKRGLPGGHIRLSFADHRELTDAARVLDQPARDEDLTIDVPGTDTEWIRQVLNRLHEAGIAADHVSVHTPDLDDVFFALTGRQNEEIPAA